MDQRLRDRLEKLEAQIKVLGDCERTFLTLEAHKRVLAAELFLKADGKSVAEKEANVYASEDWKKFVLGLVEAESRFNHERRRYELHIKAHDSEYITYKLESSAIRRQA